MRARAAIWLATVAALLAACAAGPRGTQRTLVTDHFGPSSDRNGVAAWMAAHDYCVSREWARAVEYVPCTPYPYLDARTPPIHTLFGFAEGRVVAIAVFVPAPCHIHGCDQRIETFRSRDEPFLSSASGPILPLWPRGLYLWPQWKVVPRMSAKLLAALREELEGRYGAPSTVDFTRTGMLWKRVRPDGRRELVGLFLLPGGDWVVETHEFEPR